MKRLLLLACVACAHATTTDQGREGKATQDFGPAQRRSEGCHQAEPQRSLYRRSPAWSLLCSGRRSEELEEALRGKGFAVGRSGQLDEKTRGEVAKFQKQQGIADTGLPRPRDLARRGSA